MRQLSTIVVRDRGRTAFTAMMRRSLLADSEDVPPGRSSRHRGVTRETLKTLEQSCRGAQYRVERPDNLRRIEQRDRDTQRRTGQLSLILSGMAILGLVQPDWTAMLPHVNAGRRKSTVSIGDERLVDRPVGTVVLNRRALSGDIEPDARAAPTSGRHGRLRRGRSSTARECTDDDRYRNPRAGPGHHDHSTQLGRRGHRQGRGRRP